MKNEAYQKLKEVDYSRVRNQIITVLTKFAQTKKTERGYKSEKVYMDYDVMGLACFILFLMIDTSINSFEDFETSFEDIVSNALDLHDVSMRQESIGMYFEKFTRTEEVELITELRKLANSIEFDELVAYILFADVADEIDLSFRKTPASICKLAEKILDIQQGDCVADFSTGEKNFVPEIYFRNREANYKFFNIAEETAGTKVIATNKLADSVNAIVSDRSTNHCFVIPSVKMIGAYTLTVVSVEAKIAPVTCLEPSTAAFFTEYPSPRNRQIFSITTIELSTSIPIPNTRPDIEIIFKVIPVKYISTIAVTTERGIEHAITIVGLKSFKNKKSTKIASTAPMRIFCITLSTTISMYTP